jgi:uncharacterized protein YcbX
MSSVTIKQLFYYPVKSCAGVEVAEAQVGATGLRHDRRWMVVDANGMSVTQRERPELALVVPRVANGSLSLSAPQAPDIAVPAEAGEIGHRSRYSASDIRRPRCRRPRIAGLATT